jgi:CRP-like cAMP-binding protein
MGNIDSKKKKKAKASQDGKSNDEIVADIKANPEVGRFLRGMPLLQNTSDADRDILGGALEQKTFRSGAPVFNQGDPGDGFYLIKTGSVKVLFTSPEGKSIEIATLGANDYFGESALVNSASRGAAVVCQTAVTTLFLSKVKFEALFNTGRIQIQFANRRVGVSAEGRGRTKRGDNKQQMIEEIKKPENAVTTKNSSQRRLIMAAVNECILFRELNKAQKNRVVDAFYQQAIPEGTSVIRQGDPGINFYVVEAGSFDITITKDGRTAKVAESGPGNSFGDLALMYNAKRAATVASTEDSVVWILNRYTFTHIVQQIGEAKIKQYLEFMQEVKLLAPLASYERSQLADALEEVSLPAGREVFRQGDEGDAMYLVVSGQCVVLRSENGGAAQELTRVDPGDYFGERALINNDVRAASVTCAQATQLLKLDRNAFNLLLGPLEDLLKSRVASYSSSGSISASASTSADAGSDVEVLDRTIQFEDLEYVATLGRGSFGHVTLVKHATTDITYALKAVCKAQIVETSQEEHIMNEKKIMATVHHPFFVNLITTFNSKNQLFFLLEPSMGGELFTVLRQHRFFHENTAKFYAAHIILGFECMHNKHYVYRDLKPENLLLGTDGYLKITDFGFAKKVRGRTWTLCGTPEYLAPEIVSNKGHGKGVDWWTVGILIYEMLASFTPFYHDDYMKMYAKIAKGKFKCPSHLTKHAREIIKEFLQVLPTKRLGVVRGGAALIKRHRWFNGFSWEDLLAKRIAAPIIPTVRDPFDTSNFDQVDEADPIEEYNAEDYGDWDRGF